MTGAHKKIFGGIIFALMLKRVMFFEYNCSKKANPLKRGDAKPRPTFRTLWNRAARLPSKAAPSEMLSFARSNHI